MPVIFIKLERHTTMSIAELDQTFQEGVGEFYADLETQKKLLGTSKLPRKSVVLAVLQEWFDESDNRETVRRLPSFLQDNEAQAGVKEGADPKVTLDYLQLPEEFQYIEALISSEAVERESKDFVYEWLTQLGSIQDRIHWKKKRNHKKKKRPGKKRRTTGPEDNEEDEETKAKHREDLKKKVRNKRKAKREASHLPVEKQDALGGLLSMLDELRGDDADEEDGGDGSPIDHMAGMRLKNPETKEDEFVNTMLDTVGGMVSGKRNSVSNLAKIAEEIPSGNITKKGMYRSMHKIIDNLESADDGEDEVAVPNKDAADIVETDVTMEDVAKPESRQQKRKKKRDILKIKKSVNQDSDIE
jgi:hypothetical protein